MGDQLFVAGQSATGDFVGVIIHGAQGARSLSVLLLAPAGVREARRSIRVIRPGSPKGSRRTAHPC